MATFDLSVTADKPQRVIQRPWLTYLQALGRNPRGLVTDGFMFDDLARVVMLQPQLDRDAIAYGKDAFHLLPEADGFIEGEDPFGGGGTFIGWAGNDTYPAETPWQAYWSPSYQMAENQGMNFNLFWFPPTPALFSPDIQFFPRVDWSKSASINGLTYYFSPLSFHIDVVNGLTVYEYEYDDYDAFEQDPSAMMVRTMQLPLELPASGFGQFWFTMSILPIGSINTGAAAGTYYYDDFVIRSPYLKNGGAVYSSRIGRKSIRLMPQGSPGVRSLGGGLSVLNFLPYTFDLAGGSLDTDPVAKNESDATFPTVTNDKWTPDGTAISSIIKEKDTNRILTAGDEFREFYATLNFQTSDGIRSPVLYTCRIDADGEADDKTPNAVDITNDVIINETLSADLIGYKASITLFNPDGAYNELAYRPMNRIDLDVFGVDRAVLYTLDPLFEWWQTPTKEALTIAWECGDAWVRLQQKIIGAHPAYDGMTLKAAIEMYLTREGFDPAKITVDASAANIILPKNRTSKDYQFQPKSGSKGDTLLADLHEKFVSNWRMGFNGDEDFILEPPDVTDISRVFYTSRAQAAAALADDQAAYAAGDLDDDPVAADYAYFMSDINVEFLHKDFRNEIWVVGFNDATHKPIVDGWIDVDSQINEDYVSYVGEGRVVIAITRLNHINYVRWYVEQLRKIFGTLRRHISFKTKHDPALRPGSFIKFHGVAAPFLVVSSSTPIGPGSVSHSSDNEIYNCVIEAVQYPE